ncbi:MAG: hypothetical protein IJ683_13930 [Butyrivibrio sp.]|nr:hypothetical protein [Butyrivibrio sp.]MBR1643408.1 hypothetical protein [Butyrivibrio sp.]
MADLADSASQASQASSQVTDAVGEIPKGAVSQAESVEDSAISTPDKAKRTRKWQNTFESFFIGEFMTDCIIHSFSMSKQSAPLDLSAFVCFTYDTT